jgi:AcrR family transcriptional regulator
MVRSPLIPRKQPKQGRAKATVAAILEASVQLLGKGGLSALNTNSIAERAGVSVGSLYQYFPNKDAIVVALIHHQHQRQLDALAEALEGIEEMTVDAGVRRIVRAGMQHHLDNALFASAIDHEEVRLPVGDVLDRILEEAGPSLMDYLEVLKLKVPGLDPLAALRTIPPMLRAVIDVWANLSPPDLKRAEEEGVRVVVGYIFGNTPREMPNVI